MSDIAPPSPLIDPGAARRGELAGRAASASSRAEAEAVAREFERMFLAEMLQPMFAGLSTDGPFSGGQAEEVFRPMLVDHYARAMSEAGGAGVADAVLAEILRIQGLE